MSVQMICLLLIGLSFYCCVASGIIYIFWIQIPYPICDFLNMLSHLVLVKFHSLILFCFVPCVFGVISLKAIA